MLPPECVIPRVRGEYESLSFMPQQLLWAGLQFWLFTFTSKCEDLLGFLGRDEMHALAQCMLG
ncbi:hypothetical protein EYF80_035988 [Liparis tanakae]|uniref:Uncharacterized protein n=1 Tax=Liparis tanakae TaxID=230148 RepID=A0A4Z2GLV3_9TELE|nr:hypothetical protein EYF80_035988 [Liparis tanakae]